MKAELPKSNRVETGVTRLLRNVAKDRARLLRWNTTAVVIIYAILITVALLQLERVDTLLVTSFAILGLLTFWVVNWLQWKKLEKRLYQEESRDYQKILSDETDNLNTPEAAALVVPPLTKRELEILTRIVAGGSNKQIASALGISTQTVSNHVYHILSKLNVSSRTSAAILALSNGWVKSDSGKAVDSSSHTKETVLSK
jgi:DNA-binding CsgD family transcriptional regulator